MSAWMQGSGGWIHRLLAPQGRARTTTPGQRKLAEASWMPEMRRWVVVLASDFGTGQVFWSFLWFFLWIIWIWMLILVFGDIFRSRDLSGWSKAIWTFFVIILPYLGVLVYLIARGHKIGEHTLEEASRQDAQMREYVQSVTA